MEPILKHALTVVGHCTRRIGNLFHSTYHLRDLVSRLEGGLLSFTIQNALWNYYLFWPLKTTFSTKFTSDINKNCSQLYPTVMSFLQNSQSTGWSKWNSVSNGMSFPFQSSSRLCVKKSYVIAVLHNWLQWLIMIDLWKKSFLTICPTIQIYVHSKTYQSCCFSVIGTVFLNYQRLNGWIVGLRKWRW